MGRKQVLHGPYYVPIRAKSIHKEIIIHLGEKRQNGRSLGRSEEPRLGSRRRGPSTINGDHNSNNNDISLIGSRADKRLR